MNPIAIQVAADTRRHTGRDPNLDVLRAVAILMVIVYHSAEIHTPGSAWVGRYCKLGQFGVEVFFVLSGWLIGGLYWREQRRNGFVEIPRFWGRRFLRILTPYYVGLGLAYGAVWVGRRAAFDPAYLVFLQNYRERVPYFVVSWSLCVEEHFYLLLPMLLVGFRKARALPALVAIAVVGPAVLRAVVGAPGEGEPFGFYKSHFRADGLAIGVLCAWIATCRPEVFSRLRGGARVVFAVLVVTFLTVPLWSAQAFSCGAYTVATWTAAAGLASLAGARAVPGTDNAVVRMIALSSYSLYLTHTLALLACGRMLARWTGMPSVAHRAAETVMVGVVGIGFYFLVERPAIAFRDRLSPR